MQDLKEMHENARHNAKVLSRVTDLEDRLMPAYEQRLIVGDFHKNPQYHKQVCEEYITLVREYVRLKK